MLLSIKCPLQDALWIVTGESSVNIERERGILLHSRSDKQKPVEIPRGLGVKRHLYTGDVIHSKNEWKNSTSCSKRSVQHMTLCLRPLLVRDVWQNLILVFCDALFYLYTRGIFSFISPPTRFWRPSSYRPASLTSRQLCCCQGNCENQKHDCCHELPVSAVPAKNTKRHHQNISPRFHGRTVRFCVTRPCVDEREREWTREREPSVVLKWEHSTWSGALLWPQLSLSLK